MNNLAFLDKYVLDSENQKRIIADSLVEGSEEHEYYSVRFC